jgi:PAS domain S-box-containing protein
MLSQPIAGIVTAGVLAAAIGLQLLFPALPPFVVLFPAVWLAAFVGGTIAGAGALLVALAFAALRQSAFGDGVLDRWELLSLVAFAAGAGLAIAIVHLYQATLRRLNRERVRLRAVLRAANAATWEIDPKGELFWDENFYALVGLDPQQTPPTTENFLAMVHPEDRERMAAARRTIDLGGEPAPFDEYRLTRPGGEMVWLENHRTRIEDAAGRYVIGITQDVTRRRLAEEKVRLLLREASHRAKNQFAVIQSIARETMRSTEPEEFDAAFSHRIGALARSHDLLVKGNRAGVDLRDLVTVHLAPFGAEARATLTGPELGVGPNAAQYLGMAFHELSTNAAKYGALSVPAGGIDIAWSIEAGPAGRAVVVAWQERGGPSVTIPKTSGFGSTVLLRLAPGALLGEAEMSAEPGGLRWRLTAPYEAVTSETASPGRLRAVHCGRVVGHRIEPSLRLEEAEADARRPGMSRHVRAGDADEVAIPDRRGALGRAALGDGELLDSEDVEARPRQGEHQGRGEPLSEPEFSSPITTEVAHVVAAAGLELIGRVDVGGNLQKVDEPIRDAGHHLRRDLLDAEVDPLGRGLGSADVQADRLCVVGRRPSELST